MELWDFGGPCLLEAVDTSLAEASIHAFLNTLEGLREGSARLVFGFGGSIRAFGCSWTRCVKSLGGLDSGVKGPT